VLIYENYIYIDVKIIFSVMEKHKENAYRLILASKSPRRREIISGMGVDFFVETHDIGDEHRFFNEKKSIKRSIIALVHEKSAVISQKYPENPVLSADTIVVIGKKVLGKPKNRDDARETLKMLSGKKHSVFTAVNIVLKNKGIDETAIVKTDVRFRKIGDKELDEYLDKANYMDKAGAYGIQEDAQYFVEEISGDYSNVVGLPIPTVLKLLKKFHILT
jgi:septum formation protein